MPILLVLGIILLPRLLLLTGLSVPGQGMLGLLVGISQQQPILWPSLALVIASAVAVALFPGLRRNPVAVLGPGAGDAMAAAIEHRRGDRLWWRGEGADPLELYRALE